MKVAIIGGGVMGETILAALLRSGHPHDAVQVSEKYPARAEELAARHQVTVTDNRTASAGASVVFLVVKPADTTEVLTEIADQLTADQVVVSLAAGVPLAKLHRAVPADVPVIRVMPNTPALVEQGMAALTPDERCTRDQVEAVTTLLRATGRVVEVPESQQDAVTALSGSGPAYLFLVAEALIEAGVHLGLPRPVAHELAVQTIFGSATMLAQSGQHPAVLREQVTSPGGTTAAALAALERSGLRAAFIDALAAAKHRATDLAGK